jgi:hypothetical protein
MSTRSPDNDRMSLLDFGDSFKLGAYNIEAMGDTWHGVTIGFVNTNADLCIGRENSSRGIRGIISKLEKENPYGAATIFDKLPQSEKNALQDEEKNTPKKDLNGGYCYYQKKPRDKKYPFDHMSSVYKQGELEETWINIDANF